MMSAGDDVARVKRELEMLKYEVGYLEAALARLPKELFAAAKVAPHSERLQRKLSKTLEQQKACEARLVELQDHRSV